jgi:hypothetical protein
LRKEIKMAVPVEKQMQEPEYVDVEPVTGEVPVESSIEERVKKYRARTHDATPDLPEAGGIAFMTVYWRGVPVNVTSRAGNPYDALATLISGASLAKDALGVVLEKPGAATVAPPSGPAVQASFGPQAPAAPVPTSTTSTPAGDSGLQSFMAVRMDAEVRADGKVSLKFFDENPNHKFAELTTVKTVEQAVAMLAGTGAWTAGHFKASQAYQVKYLVEWTPSAKLNTKGKPYKDVVAIRLA